MFGFILGAAVGLFVGWVLLPRPKFVDDFMKKHWPSFKID